MWAAAEGHAAVVQALIAAGADVRTRLPSGFTPLLFAVREGRPRSSACCSRPAPTSTRRSRSTAPAARLRRPPAAGGHQRAAARGDERALRAGAELLDAGANPNADLTGYTVLHAITVVRKPGVGDNDPAPEGSGRTSSLELVKKLAAQGREPERADDEAGEPEQHARERARRDAVLPRGADRGCRADEDAGGARRRHPS